MKLLYCKKCKDVVAFSSQARVCRCGASGGWASDGSGTACVTGEAAVLAFNETSLKDALEDCANREHCTEFHAHAIHDTSHTVKRF